VALIFKLAPGENLGLIRESRIWDATILITIIARVNFYLLNGLTQDKIRKQFLPKFRWEAQPCLIESDVPEGPIATPPSTIAQWGFLNNFVRGDLN
jgi:hypothetical protein